MRIPSLLCIQVLMVAIGIGVLALYLGAPAHITSAVVGILLICIFNHDLVVSLVSSFC